jgi:hypothetical protein
MHTITTIGITVQKAIINSIAGRQVGLKGAYGCPFCSCAGAYITTNLLMVVAVEMIY